MTSSSSNSSGSNKKRSRDDDEQQVIVPDGELTSMMDVSSSSSSSDNSHHQRIVRPNKMTKTTANTTTLSHHQAGSSTNPHHHHHNNNNNHIEYHHEQHQYDTTTAGAGGAGGLLTNGSDGITSTSSLLSVNKEGSSTTPILRPHPFFYYIDYSNQPDPNPTVALTEAGKVPNFPAKMHAILSRKEFHDIISWMPHGRSWRVHKPREFEVRVIPLYFEHVKFSSFIRQANGWGFHRIIVHTSDRNSYYHPLFLRGLPHLCKGMKRPGTAKKCIISPEHEPDFYAISKLHPVPEKVIDESLLIPTYNFPKVALPVQPFGLASLNLNNNNNNNNFSLNCHHHDHQHHNPSLTTTNIGSPVSSNIMRCGNANDNNRLTPDDHTSIDSFQKSIQLSENNIMGLGNTTMGSNSYNNTYNYNNDNTRMMNTSNNDSMMQISSSTQKQKHHHHQQQQLYSINNYICGTSYDSNNNSGHEHPVAVGHYSNRTTYSINSNSNSSGSSGHNSGLKTISSLAVAHQLAFTPTIMMSQQQQQHRHQSRHQHQSSPQQLQQGNHYYINYSNNNNNYQCDSNSSSSFGSRSSSLLSSFINPFAAESSSYSQQQPQQQQQQDTHHYSEPVQQEQQHLYNDEQTEVSSSYNDCWQNSDIQFFDGLF